MSRSHHAQTDPLRDFERCSFELRFGVSAGMTDSVLGYRYREFGVHQKRGGDMLSDWTFSHLPTGLRFPGWFKSVEAAAGAAVEFDRLRNDWLNISREELKTIGDAAKEICERHGGSFGAQHVGYPDDFMRPALNGFALSKEPCP